MSVFSFSFSYWSPDYSDLLKGRPTWQIAVDLTKLPCQHLLPSNSLIGDILPLAAIQWKLKPTGKSILGVEAEWWRIHKQGLTPWILEGQRPEWYLLITSKTKKPKLSLTNLISCISKVSEKQPHIDCVKLINPPSNLRR